MLRLHCRQCWRRTDLFCRIGIGLLWALACPTASADTGTDPSLIIEKNAQSYVVNRDGSYTLTVDDERTIALPQAVQAHSQHYIAYNRTLDRIIAISAWTQKPDGRRVPVRAAQIKDQQESESADAPMFQDTRVKIVVFPDVAAGDRLVLHYVMRRKTALFPGYFEDLSSSQFFLNKHFSLTYDLPASMQLHADAAGFTPVAVTSAPGRRRYRWRYEPGENDRLEADSVSYYDYGKRLAVSTFADYADFAHAFQTRAARTTRVTPAIAALARRLSGPLPDARAKTLALADWVRKNIRYVGVYVGPGGVVPHAAATVLENRYGDCKDHASLLGALLKAAGIASSGVLINGSSAYRLPQVPTLGIFTHMITYVPALDLYIDSTADSIAAGYLPDDDLDKPVLLTTSGTLSRTPAFQKQGDRYALSFEIGKTGSSAFHVAKISAGAVAEPYRQAVRDTKPADREQFVERMLQSFGQRGHGVLDPGQLDGYTDEYTMAFAGISENFANLPGPTGVATTFNFWGGIAETMAAFTQEKERRQAFVCHAIDSEDESGFTFDAALRILAVPPALVLHGAFFDYTADYTREGNTVTVRRRIVFHPDGAVCSPDDFLRMRPLVDQMMRDLKSQIIVQAAEGT